MLENPSKPSGHLRAGHRIAVLITAALARLLLIAAGFTLLACLLLLVAWWRVLSWPHRRANRTERAQAARDAALELLHAAAALYACRLAGRATCSMDSPESGDQDGGRCDAGS